MYIRKKQKLEQGEGKGDTVYTNYTWNKLEFYHMSSQHLSGFISIYQTCHVYKLIFEFYSASLTSFISVDKFSTTLNRPK